MRSVQPGIRLALALTLLLGSGTILWSGIARADVAPDATSFGPLAITSAEYKFPATVDPDVLATRPTELWAVVYRPVQLDHAPYPLLVFLHGNHATCGHGENPRIDDNTQYTLAGTCPPGYVVTPNHLGYTYLAERLASWGYIVVSINANRGINAAAGTSDDAGLNLARGRLLLKHLQRLSEWNRAGGTPPSLGVDLRGKLDFTHVGMLGHSRGGEGVRAAYNLYRDPGSPWPSRIGPLTVEGLFEIGPVDGQTSRVLNADGTTWTVLLPMCDGDVSNLQGIRPFDRMLRLFTEQPPHAKSTFTVWGANHNYYNTEWQLSDSSGCADHDELWSTTGGSPQQRQTALASVLAFFRGTVGAAADPTFTQLFNPQYDLPPVLTTVTRIDRGYTDSPNAEITTVVEDFEQPTGTNTYGIPNEARGISITHTTVPNHGPKGDPQRAAAIAWETAGAGTYFQSNWQPLGSGRDISRFQTLDLRVSRQCETPDSCEAPHLLNPLDETTCSLALVMADGRLSSPVPLNGYSDVTGPVGGLFNDGTANLHPILQTVRINLADFGNADLSRIRGVRFTFDATPTGAIYVANLRLSTRDGTGPAASPATSAARPGPATAKSGRTAGPATTGLAPGGGPLLPSPVAAAAPPTSSRPQPDASPLGTPQPPHQATRQRATRQLPPPALPHRGQSATPPTRAQLPQAQPEAGNVIRSIRTVTSGITVASGAAWGFQPDVEIELFSARGFPVRDELPLLRIGPRGFSLSRYPDEGDTHELIFTLSGAAFAQTSNGESVAVYEGEESGKSSARWEFGPLDKTMLDR